MFCFEIIIFLCFMCIIFFISKKNESNHYKNLKKREVMLVNQPYISFSKKVLNNKKIESSSLIATSVVLGRNIFKQFIVDLRNLFGGNISTYDSIIDRGKKEAILRIRETAYQQGFDYILNVKIEITALDSFYGMSSKVCVCAYGTAVKCVIECDI